MGAFKSAPQSRHTDKPSKNRNDRYQKISRLVVAKILF